MSNDYQNSSQNSVSWNDKIFFIESGGNLDIESSGRLISNYKNEDKKLISNIKKIK